MHLHQPHFHLATSVAHGQTRHVTWHFAIQRGPWFGGFGHVVYLRCLYGTRSHLVFKWVLHRRATHHHQCLVQTWQHVTGAHDEVRIGARSPLVDCCPRFPISGGLDGNHNQRYFSHAASRTRGEDRKPSRNLCRQLDHDHHVVSLMDDLRLDAERHHHVGDQLLHHSHDDFHFVESH